MRSQARRVTVTTKPAWQSKILWTQVLVFIVGVLSLPEVRSVVPLSALPYIVMVTSIASFAFRMISNSPVGPGAEKADG